MRTPPRTARKAVSGFPKTGATNRDASFGSIMCSAAWSRIISSFNELNLQMLAKHRRSVTYW